MSATRLLLKESLGTIRLWKGLSVGKRTPTAISSHGPFGPWRGWYRPGNSVAWNGPLSRGSEIKPTSLTRSMPRVCSRDKLSRASSICCRLPFGKEPSYWFSIRMATVIWFSPRSWNSCKSETSNFRGNAADRSSLRPHKPRNSLAGARIPLWGLGAGSLRTTGTMQGVDPYLTSN